MPIPPTFPAIAAQQQYLQLQVWNGLIPPEGLQCMRVPIDWSAGTAFSIDLTSGNLQGKLTNIQSVYIDNSGNDASVSLQSIVAGGINETLGAGWQAFLPILQPNPPKFVVQSSGTGKTNLYFANAPLPAVAWPSTQGTFRFDSNGNLLVSDAALDAIIVGGALQVANAPVLTSPFSSAAFSFAGAGDNTIVGGTALQTIKVYGIELLVGGATNLTFKDSTPTNFSGALPFAANGGEIKDRGSYPWYTCAAGADFQINSSIAVQVSGTVWYIKS